MIIRPATDADIPAIHRLIEKGTTNGKILKRSVADIRANRKSFLVAEMDDEVVGCVSLEVYSHKLAEVRSLSVAKERQRLGIATALIAACVKRAEKRNVFEVLAITDKLNLFKRHRFSEQLHGQKALFLRP